MFPVGVKLFWPSIIQLFHSSRRWSLNGFFRKTSSGWRILVKPPGITAMSVFVWRTARFTESMQWAWKESQMRRLFVLNRRPGRDRHTFSTHSFIPAWSIHPFRWQCTRTPGGKYFIKYFIRFEDIFLNLETGANNVVEALLTIILNTYKVLFSS